MSLKDIPTDILLRQINQGVLKDQKGLQFMTELQKRGVIAPRQLGLINEQVKQHGNNEYRDNPKRPIIGDTTFEPVNYEDSRYVRHSPQTNRLNILSLI